MDKENKAPKLFLIDGNSLIYKAYYALPDTMKSPQGVTTNALYGFTNMLLKILDKKPDYIAVAFDRGGPTFRHKEFKEYKAKRQKAPDSLKEQLPLSKDIADAFGVRHLDAEGFEADDIIATLARTAEKQGLRTYIYTGDKDAFQLVSDKIKVMATLKGISDTVEYGPEQVIEKMGVGPEHITDYKALAGDQSDNIPGIPGIGEKTAISLIGKFGGLEDILSKAEMIDNPKLREKVMQNAAIAKLSKHLATVITDVPVAVDIKALEFKGIDWGRLMPVLEKYDFRSLVKKYSQSSMPLRQQNAEEAPQAKKEIDVDYRLLEDGKEISGLIGRLSTCTAFAFDTETTSLDPLTAEIVGISFSMQEKQAFFVPWTKMGQEERSALARVFDDRNILKVAHNLKFDSEMLQAKGIRTEGPIFDTLIAAYVLDPESQFGLKALARRHFGAEMTEYSELLGPARGRTIKDVPVESLSDYSCADADMTFRLFKKLGASLSEDKRLEQLFKEVEMPLLKVLMAMETCGVKIDTDKLSEIGAKLKERVSFLEEQIHIIAGEQFNINSTKKLSDILFNKLMLPSGKKTKSGHSTDSSVLESLADDFEIARLLLEYRQLAKLLSTYVEALPGMVSHVTGMVHTSFNQFIAATGRLSSSNPNLQNIPIRSGEGKLIRDAFVPSRKGGKILCADYSQIELRILAHFSGDPVLTEEFRKDADIHSAVAAELYGVRQADVTKDMRNAAKTINFGIIYGMGPVKLSKTLGIKRKDAEDFIRRYFERFPKIKQFTHGVVEQARKDGYVSTMLGRRRYLRNILGSNMNERAGDERAAVNTVIQGTAADMIKMAMINISKEIISRELRSHMIMQIHDELVFDCVENEIPQIKEFVLSLMPAAIELSVPVKVDVGVGDSWGQAKG